VESWKGKEKWEEREDLEVERWKGQEMWEKRARVPMKDIENRKWSVWTHPLGQMQFSRAIEPENGLKVPRWSDQKN
jgi:hypothetical protein